MNDKPVPARIKKLPVDHRGFPIPWFVAVLPDGTRDFRIADPVKKTKAVNHNLCWVCGEMLGTYKAFVIGPMCAVNRTTAEPPCHLECAHYSAHACPFLSRPRMRRNDKGLENIGAQDPAGVFLTRNPGCTCIWVCKGYKIFKTSKTEWLIRLGEPTDIYWFASGHTASRAQVLDSINSGMPALEEMAKKESFEAVKELAFYRQRVEQYLPKR